MIEQVSGINVYKCRVGAQGGESLFLGELSKLISFNRFLFWVGCPFEMSDSDDDVPLGARVKAVKEKPVKPSKPPPPVDSSSEDDIPLGARAQAKKPGMAAIFQYCLAIDLVLV
jgi:hypothetical protein